MTPAEPLGFPITDPGTPFTAQELAEMLFHVQDDAWENLPTWTFGRLSDPPRIENVRTFMSRNPYVFAPEWSGVCVEGRAEPGGNCASPAGLHPGCPSGGRAPEGEGARRRRTGHHFQLRWLKAFINLWSP